MAINKILLLVAYCELHLIWAQIVIPKTLRACYRNNNTVNAELPMNLRVLVDIIQKMERHSYSAIDMRIMSSSLLHRFKFDGIEYQKDIQATDSVLPFSATGTQRTKNKLIEELIPGNAEALPVHILSQVEQCILHQSISNSIFRLKTDGTYKPCRQVSQNDEITGKGFLAGEWDCPRQRGVILTPYGTVAPGAIIGAVAAALQHQNVAVHQLVANLEIPLSDTYSLKYNEEEIDFVLPRSEMIHQPSMWYNSLLQSTVKLDNMWLTTIAGELAEMVVYQGPLWGNNMTLGATGFWQDAAYPTIYYLTSSNDSFDATRAELIGGIDGMVIASYLQTWIQDFYSLRLSQILEMYYSHNGVTFNTNVKACERVQTFILAVPRTILNEQTYAIAQMLAYRRSIAYISPEALQRMVDVATEKFYSYAEKHLFPELPCNEQGDQPRVEVLIVLDGAWTVEFTVDFLSTLVQELDVSMYGSRMGVIHGTSGAWMLNVTDSPSLAFQTFNNFTNTTWPTKLNYTQVLATISTYLNESWKYNGRHYRIGNLGQVVLLLTPLGYMSSNDEGSVLTLLNRIKSNHPDTYFLYYASRYNANLFKKFLLTREDHLITNSNIHAITQYMLKIPKTIRPATPIESNSSKVSQFEDYITPSKSITYRIHSHWKRSMKKILITVHTFGYGTMKICQWVAFESNQRINMQCTELAGYKEITLTDRYKCTKDSSCPDVFLRIQNVSSLYKCAEIDCKTPDQVRYIIRTNPQDLRSGNSAAKDATLTQLCILISFAFQLAFVRILS